MPADQTAPSRPAKPAPPMPLVKLTKHPIRWLTNKLILLIAALLLAYIGTLIIVALYYLCFETNASMTGTWHTVVSNADLRHNIRNVGEGFLGGLLAQAIVWNHYKRRKTQQSRLDEWEIKYHIANLKDDRALSFGQLLASPFLALIYAIPGFFVAIGLAWLIQHNVAHLHVLANLFQPIGHFLDRAPTGHSLWARFQATWSQNWPKKLMGFGASFFFGRRPVKGVFDDLQLWFAEQRLRSGKSLRWYHPPTFQARYNDIKAHQATIESNRHGKWQRVMMTTLLVVGLGLAGYGWYVLAFYASA